MTFAGFLTAIEPERNAQSYLGLKPGLETNYALWLLQATSYDISTFYDVNHKRQGRGRDTK